MSTDDRRDNGRQDDRFDARLRAHHTQAVDALSPRTQAQLRLRRQAALRAASPSRTSWPRGIAWPVAAACAVGVLALGLQWRQAGPDVVPASPTQDVVAASADDAAGDVTALDESPEFYLWLASSDAQALAME